MEQPDYKFRLRGGTEITCSELDFILHPGVKEIIGSCVDHIWTGHVILWTRKVNFSVGDIEWVEYRSSLDESDEEWERIHTTEESRIHGGEKYAEGFYEYWEGVYQTILNHFRSKSTYAPKLLSSEEYYTRYFREEEPCPQ